jgi:hypothetical protein
MRTKLLSAIVEARIIPQQSTLADAPLLRDWMAAIDPNGVLCLAGVISGHPRLRDEKVICTSLLLSLDLEGNWARTLSRWYRLTGQPSVSIEADVRNRRFTPVDRARAQTMAAEIRDVLWLKYDGHINH